MRVWVGADADALRALHAGAALTRQPVAAESDDEAHEHEALLAAAEDGPVVVVAEVADDEDVTLEAVEALHVDVDGSGDLAWFATQELEAVLAVLEAR